MLKMEYAKEYEMRLYVAIDNEFLWHFLWNAGFLILWKYVTMLQLMLNRKL